MQNMGAAINGELTGAGQSGTVLKASRRPVFMWSTWSLAAAGSEFDNCSTALAIMGAALTGTSGRTMAHGSMEGKVTSMDDLHP